MNSLRPTPECDANAFVARKVVGGEYHGLHDAITLTLGEKLERERDSAKTLNRSLLDQLETKDAQIEALRDAVEKLRDSLEVGKDSVETWDWCNKMLTNLQPPSKS